MFVKKQQQQDDDEENDDDDDEKKERMYVRFKTCLRCLNIILFVRFKFQISYTRNHYEKEDERKCICKK